MGKFTTENQPLNRRKPDKLTELLKQRLNEPATLNPDITHISQIIDKLLELAKQGNIKAIELIFERVEGKVQPQPESTYTPPQVVIIEKDTNTLQPVYTEVDILEQERIRNKE